MNTRHHPSGRTLRTLMALGVVAALVVGCGSSAPTKVPSGSSAPGSSAPLPTAGPPQPNETPVVVPVIGEIPPGREIAEGGGGPVQYTFREEWRRALAEAQKWRSGAYLIKAFGDQVNDEGVPSYWSMAFIDKADADAALEIEIDPWGKITKTEEFSGESMISFVDEFTQRIPYDVIDSDQVVAIGKPALGEVYALAKTKDPRIMLSTSALTDGVLHWTYMLFNGPTAEYVSAIIDPHSGAVTLAK